MAVFDFLSKPVGGYTAPDSYSGQDFMRDDMFTQQPKSDVTWGQLIGAISKLSNQQSSQQLGSFLTDNFTLPQSQQNVYKIGPTQDFLQDEKKSETSISEIMSILGAIALI